MKNVTLVETVKDEQIRFHTPAPETRNVTGKRGASVFITINPDKTYQTIEGFGGAITEASGYVLSQIPLEERNSVMRAYFDPVQGNGYSIVRTHMNSCDFSLGNWACCEKEDPSLANFSMEQPEKFQIPFIQQARDIAGNSLKLMVSPWSPPGWMKDTGKMNNGGKLLKKYYPTWARYFVKYIGELEKRGIPTWCLTIQNEPEASQTWDSCLYTATEEAEFAVQHLGPELEKSGYKIPILVWDHNRDRLWDRVEESMKFPGADKYIAGAAYHWYSGDDYHTVQAFSRAYPEKMLVFTEGCVEGGPRPGAWFTGERYAHNVINDLNNGCTAWIDWNIALDTQGGPNHVGNYCDAPVLVDTKTGKAQYQSSFYYLGHFSKYIKPGAVRIDLALTASMIPAAVDGRIGNTVESCAFKNPDGSILLVIYNRNESDITFSLNCGNLVSDQILLLPPRAIQTWILK